MKLEKNDGSSQFGPYTLASATCVPYRLPVATTYLPLGLAMVDDRMNGLSFLIKIAVPCYLNSFLEQNI